MYPDPDELAGRVLCRVDDLASIRAKDVVIVNGEEQYSIMVVEWKGDVRAFINSCPHARVPLNIVSDTFFDRTGNYLLCTMHGAHFRPTDGYCTRGPCRGKSLKPFPIKVEAGEVIVVPEER
jgi:nitrite reductase/ring-hydroxylating ferredoxin subunit